MRLLLGKLSLPLQRALEASRAQADGSAATWLLGRCWLSGRPAVGRFRVATRSLAVVVYRPVMDAVLVSSGSGSHLLARVRPPLWDILLLSGGVASIEAHSLARTGEIQWLALAFGIILHVFAHYLSFVPLAQEAERVVRGALVGPQQGSGQVGRAPHRGPA